MKVKCYSVRLKSLYEISAKCRKAVSFDGKECLIPESQIFGIDIEVTKCDAYWISAWILEKKDIQYSTKKEAWFDSLTGDILSNVGNFIRKEKHIPEKIENRIIEQKKELER